MSLLIIGEIASSHDGDLNKARQLVKAAFNAGCDVAKIQFWSDADRLADLRGSSDEARSIYRKYRVPAEWLPILRNEFKDHKLAATCFLPEDVSTVLPYIDCFKVSAFECENYVLMDEINRVRKESGFLPLIVSVNSLVSVTDALIERLMPGDLLLYCVSEYPANRESIQLEMINKIQEKLLMLSNVSAMVGYSDHSGLVSMGREAARQGARAIEFHLKLSTTNKENPDAGEFAHMPESAKAYVQQAREGCSYYT